MRLSIIILEPIKGKHSEQGFGGIMRKKKKMDEISISVHLYRNIWWDWARKKGRSTYKPKNSPLTINREIVLEAPKYPPPSPPKKVALACTFQKIFSAQFVCCTEVYYIWPRSGLALVHTTPATLFPLFRPPPPPNRIQTAHQAYINTNGHYTHGAERRTRKSRKSIGFSRAPAHHNSVWFEFQVQQHKVTETPPSIRGYWKKKNVGRRRRKRAQQSRSPRVSDLFTTQHKRYKLAG